MIYSLDGTLTYFDQNFAVVSCGGVGFKCFTTLTTLQSLPGVGKPVQLFTYLSVREDALDLYGFATTAELDCFKPAGRQFVSLKQIRSCLWKIWTWKIVLCLPA